MQTFPSRLPILNFQKLMNTNNLQSESFQQIVKEAAKLYLDYGRFGKNLFPDGAEDAITVELEKLTTFSIAQMSTPEALLRAALDPAKEEEAKRLALNVYELIVRSLPGGAITGKTD